MILTQVDPAELSNIAEIYGAHLVHDPAALAVFRRIMASVAITRPEPECHAEAVALTERFGMAPLNEAPAAAFSWDGSHVRSSCTEPSVLIHEVAHYQLASPTRRALPDFGLGAGPETGRIADADAARCLGDTEREAEEQMASLLGILWEVTLDQPGIHSFLEQNWLEGAQRPTSAAFFSRTLQRLQQLGLVDDDGRPILTLRATPDP
jgi:hypothetical protein